MAPTAAAPAAAPTGSSGRKAGIANYTKPELEHLFRCMRSILPIGPEEWDAVTSLHAEKFPGRDTDSIRNKYIRLYRKKMPTGDPIRKWDVKQAKEIKYLIGDRASILNGEEIFDIETGEFVPAADDDEEPSGPPPLPLCQPTQPTQLTQSTQGTTQGGTEDNRPDPLLLGQPTQPTQIDEVATELTPTSTISGGVSTNKKRAYGRKAEKDTHLMSVIAAALREGREDRKLHLQALESHRAALELQQRRQDKADEEKKVADRERKLMFQVLVSLASDVGAKNTPNGKLKRKLEHLRLCADDRSADDSSDESDGDEDNR